MRPNNNYNSNSSNFRKEIFKSVRNFG